MEPNSSHRSKQALNTINLSGGWNGVDAIMNESFILRCLSALESETYFHFPKKNVQNTLIDELNNHLSIDIINAFISPSSSSQSKLLVVHFFNLSSTT